MAKAKCPYEECKLPKNNSHYSWQIVYMLVGLGVLFFKAENFTFFQTFLFLAPVELDVLNVKFEGKFLNAVRLVFAFFDAALLICCFFGFFGAFQDTGISFAVSETFLFFSGVEVEKTIVGIIIAINLAVPILFYIGAPCQQTIRLLNKAKSTRQKEEQRV